MEYGLRHRQDILCLRNKGLNPCCSGIWSETGTLDDFQYAEVVLILVVVEYGLRQTGTVRNRMRSLNPCCSGIWSETCMINSMWSELCLVLILVVVEYGLRLGQTKNIILKCLNPCCSGIWSETSA